MKTKTLTDALYGKSYGCLMHWCYKFLKGVGFSIRKSTHISQALKFNAYELFDRFIFNVITYRKELNIIKI